MENILEIKNLTTSFSPAPAKCSGAGHQLQPEKGRVPGHCGGIGSGKSVSSMSILKLLPGTARIKAGEILFGGMDLSKMTPHQLRKVRGNRFPSCSRTPCPA